ncbi:Uncharacterized protein Adt_17728 [Abeliophyllum distichum]|uniref:Uncharacterized protein n=1 Tax=Abeliophyllum distichum TaxID=126358 RepID=A0ABD1THB4_9LAMI
MEEAVSSEDIDPRITGVESQTSPVEELEGFTVDPNDPTMKLQVGKDFLEKSKEAMKRFLRHNLDIFAWKHEDMVGIDPKVSYHHLNVDPKFLSHRHKKRSLNLEKYEALKEEEETGSKWTAECEAAFQALKKHLGHALLLLKLYPLKSVSSGPDSRRGTSAACLLRKQGPLGSRDMIPRYGKAWHYHSSSPP